MKEISYWHVENLSTLRDHLIEILMVPFHDWFGVSTRKKDGGGGGKISMMEGQPEWWKSALP